MWFRHGRYVLISRGLETWPLLAVANVLIQPVLDLTIQFRAVLAQPMIAASSILYY